MRIRSIHPEFYRSEDIAALAWDVRLVFIGIWSYVDDNGAGRDNERLIVSEIFPLEDDPRDTLATVSRALATLSDGGQIIRYEVDSKRYLHVTAWKKWQKIDKPGKERYPLPTREDAVIRETVATVSRLPRDTLAPGEGEKGRRGEGISSASADAEREFDEWYSVYPRKRGKGQALKAYKAARKKTSASTLLRSVQEQIPSLTARGPGYVPYPATWLNGERWDDEITDDTDDGHVGRTPETLIPPDEIGLDPVKYDLWVREQMAARRTA